MFMFNPISGGGKVTISNFGFGTTTIKEDLHRKFDFSFILLIQTTSAGMK